LQVVSNAVEIPKLKGQTSRISVAAAAAAAVLVD
jgi:hypothetical protein